MTDEEKAEEYVKNIISIAPKMYDGHKKIIMKESYMDGYKDGYEQGRKEKCFEQNKDGTIRPCEVMKENEQLKEQIENLKETYKKQRNKRIDELQKKNAELKKYKELSCKVGKVTKSELNKCKTIEEKMEWLGKVLGYAIFKDDMNYAVWVNVQKNNIIAEFEKENEQLKAKISVLLSCANCPENKGGYICAKEYNDKCLSQKIEYIKELEEQIEKMKCLLKENSIDCEKM